MKLIYCKNCMDVVRLNRETRVCRCGQSGGFYKNDVDALYWGENALPLGIAWSSFLAAVRYQPDSGWGEEFEAFVIPKQCPTMHKIDSPTSESSAAISPPSSS